MVWVLIAAILVGVLGIDSRNWRLFLWAGPLAAGVMAYLLTGIQILRDREIFLKTTEMEIQEKFKKEGDTRSASEVAKELWKEKSAELKIKNPWTHFKLLFLLPAGVVFVVYLVTVVVKV